MIAAEFNELLEPYQKIVKDYVGKRLNFYTSGIDQKRHLAQNARLVSLVLSLTIPVVANLDFKEFGTPVLSKSIILTLMSLMIALMTGLNQLYQWQRLWEKYAAANVQIESLMASWDLQVIKARTLDNSKDISDVLETATESLKKSVDQIVLAEMGAFFAVSEQTATEKKT